MVLLKVFELIRRGTRFALPNHQMLRSLIRCCLGAWLLLFIVARVEAVPLTLAWDASRDSEVVGYRVLYGTRSGFYPSSVDVGLRTEYTLSVGDGTHYFAVQAYNTAGIASAPSNEVSATVLYDAVTTTASSAGSCGTPDPFVALGGGTCYNGGWYPPGMAIPGVSTSSSPTPAPTYGTSSCATGDPFVALGGGTCYNGDWFPPGMAIPGPTTNSYPTPSPTPAPTYSTPSCATPDPFVALGGGTCSNGGWYPPGMSIPGAPTSSSPTPAASSSCATPDPFVALGGGTCYNGDWYPPGMTTPGAPTSSSPTPAPSSSCSTPDPFIALGGGTCYNGNWYPPGMEISSDTTVRNVNGTVTLLTIAELAEPSQRGPYDWMFSTALSLAAE
jgi:hypothetical protein